MTDQYQVLEELIETLTTGWRVLSELPEGEFDRSPEPLAKSTVGAHVRHVLDACDSLLEAPVWAGSTESCEPGRINYDDRIRDASVERDPQRAGERVARTLTRLTDLRGRDLERRLLVRADAPKDLPPQSGWRQSSLGRELSYVLSHTIHHYALIAMILRFRGIDPGASFGVAPSTLRYWEESERCAPLRG